MAASTSTTIAEGKLPDKFEPVAEVQRRYRKELDSLRSKLSDPTSPTMDDVALYRILKGWKFDEAKAAATANETIKWRKENKLDALRPIARAETQRQFPNYDKFVRCHPHNISHGVDRIGQPMSIERIGKGDPAQLVRTVKLNELLDYHYHHMENKTELANELTRSSGKVYRLCKIMDLDGLGRRHMNRGGLGYLQVLLHLTQLHYPEMMGNLWIVNAPGIFNLIWKIVKPWLNEQTLSKITILGTNYKETLHKHIDPANLPDFLGGTCTCNQAPGGCVAMIHPDEGMTIVNIAARASESVRLIAEEKDTLINWEFRTRAYDIGFQVEFIPRGATKGNVVVPHGKHEAAKETISGEFVAPDAGTIVLTWDNNHSRFYSKTLLHRTNVARAEPDPPSTTSTSSTSEDIKDVVPTDTSPLPVVSAVPLSTDTPSSPTSPAPSSPEGASSPTSDSDTPTSVSVSSTEGVATAPATTA